MAVSLTSFSEKQAEKAETLPAFRGFSLQAFKQKVADLLRLIEQGEIFDLYTKHHMTQIDSMLHLLEWLIPENTQSIMSPADWLLIVLAIYFHDFGLLVTKKEFELRNLSGFPEFRDNILFAGDGEDYRIKVEQEFSDHEEVERFLYQEFVRYKHAERIRTWITDAPSVSFGDIDDTLQEIHQLLKPLSQQFRRDLAMVCESHHFDDLNDFKKYNVSRPYGNSD